MKKVGIIIVNWNSLRLGYVKDLVASLNKINYPESDYKIFISDNKSEDGSPDYMEENLNNSIVIRNEDNLGFSEGNNRVVDRMIREGYDYAYLLNHDTQVDSDFLMKAVEMMDSDDNIGSVQSLLLLHQDVAPEPYEEINSIGNAIHFLGFGFSKGGYEKLSNYTREELNGKELAYGSGAGVLLNLEVIKKVGLFDTHFFMYHEDLDLGWKIKMAGCKNLLCYDSLVYHKYEFSKSMDKYYYMERNRYIVLFENFKIATLILIAPFLIAFELGTLIFSFKSGFWKQKVKVYPYFLKYSSWKLIFKHRKEKKKFRKNTDRNILKNFSGKISNQNIDNALLTKVVNPIAQIYFSIIKFIIFW